MKLRIEAHGVATTIETDEVTLTFEREESKSVEEILSDFYAGHPDGSEHSEIIDRLKAIDVWDLKSGVWVDVYDKLGYLPPCPKCREPMLFCKAVNMLRCPDCGYALSGDEYPYIGMPAWFDLADDQG